MPKKIIEQYWKCDKEGCTIKHKTETEALNCNYEHPHPSSYLSYMQRLIRK